MGAGDIASPQWSPDGTRERAVINSDSFVGAADMSYRFATLWFHVMPWHESAAYLARSPISYVDAVTTPVPVIHNQDDFRVPLDQGCSSTPRSRC